MRLLRYLPLLLPLSAFAVDLSYTPPESENIPAPAPAPAPATGQEAPRFQLTPDESLIKPTERYQPPTTGNPSIDGNARREYENCQRLRQRMLEQGKSMSGECQ